jgi:heavy metal translocating P-type ATPase
MSEAGSIRASRPSETLCAHCDLPVPARRRAGSAETRQFCCFGCHIAHELARPAAGTGAPTVGGTLLLRLGLGIFLAMNIMAFSWVSYAQELFGAAGEVAESYRSLAGLFAYLLLFLCTLVVALLGLPLARDAMGNLLVRGPDGHLLRGRIDANLLICVGVGSAYALSVVHTLRGAGSLYYDTAAMVLVLVTLGNYLEAQAKRRAAQSGEALLASASRSAWVDRDGRVVEVDTDRVEPGDRVRVRPGETVPVDGPIVDGASLIDESSLTGESRPRPARAGDAVLAGSLSLDGLVWVRARRVGADRVVARMRQLLHEARLRQPPIQRLADRIAALFVPGVILVALGLFGWHAWRGDATVGLFVGLSVLLISCPCALGLAAPLATWNALRRAAARGILVDSAVTLERAAAVARLFFDKTGTLTRSEPTLTRIFTARGLGEAETRGLSEAEAPDPHDLDAPDMSDAEAPGLSEAEALELAASLESASLHPVARALVAAARDRGLDVKSPDESRTLPGIGVEGRIGGRSIAIGNARLFERGGLDGGALASAASADETMTVFLCDRERVLARFELAECLRADARETLETLRRMRIDTSVLTGDRSDPAARLARELGLTFEAGLLPEEKLERLERSRRATGRSVAMVGDGINDAPVLAAADVGIAMGSAADLAKHAGNVGLISDRLDRVPLLLAIARHCHRRIRVNLTWAFAYNVVGIPLAAAGLLSPVFAAVAMIASSLTIVAVSRGAGAVELVNGDGASPARAGPDPTALDDPRIGLG